MKAFRLVVFLLLTSLLLPTNSKAQSCIPDPPATSCSITNSVNVTATVLESTITFSGYAPINSVVTFKEANSVVGTTTADSSGFFTKTISTTAGTHSFTVSATDTDGLTTPYVDINNVNVDFHSDTQVPNLNLPPTITASKTQIKSPETIVISGQGPPGSTVNLYLNGKKIYSASITVNGLWRYDLSTGLAVGNNTLYATLSRGNSDSENSTVVTIQLLECKSDGTCTSPPPTTGENNPPSETTKTTQQNINLKIGIDIGINLLFFLITSIFTFQFLIIILLIFFIWFWSRRRKKRKEEVLQELEEKVERDMHRDNPDLRVEKDFWEAEKEIE